MDSSFSYINLAYYSYTSPNFAGTGTAYDDLTPISGIVSTSFTMSSTDAIILVFSGLDFEENDSKYDISIWAAIQYLNPNQIQLTFDQILG